MTKFLEQREEIIYYEVTGKTMQDLLDTTSEHVLISDIIIMKMKKNRSNKGYLREEVQLKMLRKCLIVMLSEIMIWAMEEKGEKEIECHKKEMRILLRMSQKCQILPRALTPVQREERQQTAEQEQEQEDQNEWPFQKWKRMDLNNLRTNTMGWRGNHDSMNPKTILVTKKLKKMITIFTIT